MSKKIYKAPYDVSEMLSGRMHEVSRRLQEIWRENTEKTRQQITSEANKLAYDLAEKEGLSLWDICLRTIPDRSWDMEEVDGKMTMVVKVKLEPIEFDFTHSPDYWEKKYHELMKKIIGLTIENPDEHDEDTTISDNQ